MDVFSNYAMYTIIVPDYPIGTGLFLLGGIGVTAAPQLLSMAQGKIFAQKKWSKMLERQVCSAHCGYMLFLFVDGKESECKKFLCKICFQRTAFERNKKNFFSFCSKAETNYLAGDEKVPAVTKISNKEKPILFIQANISPFFLLPLLSL